MIDTERINTQLSLSCEMAIASVDPGGGGGLMIDMEGINRQLSLSHENAIASVDPRWGGGELTPPETFRASTGWPLVFNIMMSVN